MARRNLAGNYWGESQRLTIRLSPADMRTLDELAEAWQSDRSEVLRRALREVAVSTRKRRRDELLSALPFLTLGELRALARDHQIRGRSKMTKPRLQAALLACLQPRP